MADGTIPTISHHDFLYRAQRLAMNSPEGVRAGFVQEAEIAWMLNGGGPQAHTVLVATALDEFASQVPPENGQIFLQTLARNVMGDGPLPVRLPGPSAGSWVMWDGGEGVASLGVGAGIVVGEEAPKLSPPPAALVETIAPERGVLSRTLGSFAAGLRVLGRNAFGLGKEESQIEALREQRLHELAVRMPGNFPSLDSFTHWVRLKSVELGRPENDLVNAFNLYTRAAFAGFDVEDGVFAGVRDTHFNRPVDLYYQIITQPTGTPSKGTVMIIPDAGLSMAEYFDEARAHLEQGFNVMFYDPRGQGLSSFLPRNHMDRSYQVAGTLDSIDNLEGDLDRACHFAHQALEGPLFIFAEGGAAQVVRNYRSRYPENKGGINDVFLANLGLAPQSSRRSWEAFNVPLRKEAKDEFEADLVRYETDMAYGRRNGVTDDPIHPDVKAAADYFASKADGAKELPVSVWVKRARRTSQPMAAQGKGPQVLTQKILALLTAHRKDGLEGAANMGFQTVTALYNWLLPNAVRTDRLQDSVSTLYDVVPGLNYVVERLGLAASATIDMVLKMILLRPEALNIVLGPTETAQMLPISEMAEQVVFETNPKPPATMREWEAKFEEANAPTLAKLEAIGREVEDLVAREWPKSEMSSPQNPLEVYMARILGEGKVVEDLFRSLYESEQALALPDFTHITDAELALRKTALASKYIQSTLLGEGLFYSTEAERLNHASEMQDMMDRLQIAATYHEMVYLRAETEAGRMFADEWIKYRSILVQRVVNFVKKRLSYSYNQLKDELPQLPLAERPAIARRMRAIMREQLTLTDWQKRTRVDVAIDPIQSLKEAGLWERTGLTDDMMARLGRDKPEMGTYWRDYDAVRDQISIDLEKATAHVNTTIKGRADFIHAQKLQALREFQAEIPFQDGYYGMLVERARRIAGESGKTLSADKLRAVKEARAEYGAAMKAALKYSEAILSDDITNKYFTKISKDKAASRAYLRLHASVMDLYADLGPKESRQVHAYSAVFPSHALLMENARTDVEAYRDFFRVGEEIISHLGDRLEGVADLQLIEQLQTRFALDGLTSFFRTARYGMEPGVAGYFNFRITPEIMEKAWANGEDVDIVRWDAEEVIIRFKHGLLQFQNHSGQMEFYGFCAIGMGTVAQDTVEKVPGIGPAAGVADMMFYLDRNDAVASASVVTAALAGGANVNVYRSGTRQPNGFHKRGINPEIFPHAAVLFPHNLGDSYITGYAGNFTDNWWTAAYQNGGEAILGEEGRFNTTTGGTPMSRSWGDAKALGQHDIFPYMATGETDFDYRLGRPIHQKAMLDEKKAARDFWNYSEEQLDGSRKSFLTEAERDLVGGAYDIFEGHYRALDFLGVTSPDSFKRIFMQLMDYKRSLDKANRGLKARVTGNKELKGSAKELYEACSRMGLTRDHYEAIKKVRILMHRVNGAYFSFEQRIVAENPNYDAQARRLPSQRAVPSVTYGSPVAARRRPAEDIRAPRMANSAALRKVPIVHGGVQSPLATHRPLAASGASAAVGLLALSLATQADPAHADFSGSQGPIRPLSEVMEVDPSQAEDLVEIGEDDLEEIQGEEVSLNETYSLNEDPSSELSLDSGSVAWGVAGLARSAARMAFR